PGAARRLGRRRAPEPQVAPTAGPGARLQRAAPNSEHGGGGACPEFPVPPRQEHSMGHANTTFVATLVAAAAASAALLGCDVKKTQEGNVTLPKYEVEKKQSGDVTLPKYEVTPPDVTVTKKDVEVTVPKVTTEKETVTVPDVQVKSGKEK